MSPLRISRVKKGTLLLFCLLLLELALLFFQYFISSAINSERVTLGQMYKNLTSQREQCQFLSNQLKIYEDEEVTLKQKLPNNIDSVAQAITQTRERLNVLKIVGEVNEKTRHNHSFILETVCVGSFIDLAALLDSFREENHAVRLSRLTVEALGNGQLCFTVETEYALHQLLQNYEDEDV